MYVQHHACRYNSDQSLSPCDRGRIVMIDNLLAPAQCEELIALATPNMAKSRVASGEQLLEYTDRISMTAGTWALSEKAD